MDLEDNVDYPLYFKRTWKLRGSVTCQRSHLWQQSRGRKNWAVYLSYNISMTVPLSDTQRYLALPLTSVIPVRFCKYPFFLSRKDCPTKLKITISDVLFLKNYVITCIRSQIFNIQLREFLWTCSSLPPPSRSERDTFPASRRRLHSLPEPELPLRDNCRSSLFCHRQVLPDLEHHLVESHQMFSAWSVPLWDSSMCVAFTDF